MSVVGNGKVSIFGIRHHGPGSARSLLKGLEKLKPDCILVEGPPEADGLIKHVAAPDMKPPVSILVYAQDNLRQAVYYPFAVFSPEWQALLYGVGNSVPVRFMDLQQTNWLALERQRKEAMLQEHSEDAGVKPAETSTGDYGSTETGATEDSSPEDASEEHAGNSFLLRNDPLSYLAKADGFDDSERWWEKLVEHRREDLEVFAAIREAMTTLRNELQADELIKDEYERLREASMRQTIRAAIKEGFERIAVVCGAWHVPALSELPPAREDQGLLKGLPKVKTECTWIPWTYGRLSFQSGYGAGIESPGWYHHLWVTKDRVVERWLARVAHLLREQDLDASSAHIIEAVRLAEALAGMRSEPLPGLAELSESVQSVFCHGNPVPLTLIYEKLVVGEIMGEVPPDLPGTPLQKDLEREQKRLRMPAQPSEKIFDLDLRNENDLLRSHLLHRLEILKVNWGVKQESTGKGTFHEIWRVQWMPEFALALIEASVWGRSVESAASAFACKQSDKDGELSALTVLLDRVLKADLPEAVEHVMKRVENEAAVAVDIRHLMAALPALVQVARYGDVRKTDASSVKKILAGLVSRICVGLPSACSSVDEAAAQEIFELILKVHSSISLLQNEEFEHDWQDALIKLADGANMNGLIAGRASRLLFDRKVFDSVEAARRFGLALSTASEPALAAAFADGFLRGSAAVLIHDSELFNVVDQWVVNLNEDAFTQILPLMRRTLSTYTPPERRQIGRRVAGSGGGFASADAKRAQLDDIDRARGDKVIPVLVSILGLKPLVVEDEGAQR